MRKVCILGQGYIGLPTALVFATHGLNVVGMDVNERIIHTLSNGGLHIQEPGLEEYFDKAVGSGNLTFSITVEEADAFIITVPTPFLNDSIGEYNGQIYKKADMQFVVSAAEMILPYLNKGNLVILESTSPPRTTVDLVQPILERSGLRAGEDFFLVYCPERVLPGQILKELIDNARVIGGVDRQSAEAGRDLYASFVKGDILLTDATTAEMVKLMENTYRDVNIAIANEFSRLADRFGINIWEAIDIANRHPRVKILNPGAGVGGHCISVDPWFLVEAAPELARLIYAARSVNDSQPDYVIEFVTRCLNGTVKGSKIAVLGLSFKPGVDDLRESPAIDIARKLGKLGAMVKAYEPFKLDVRVPEIQTVSSLEEVLESAEILLLLVGHKEFAELDPIFISRTTQVKTVIDTTNLLNQTEWMNAGFIFYRLGIGIGVTTAA